MQFSFVGFLNQTCEKLLAVFYDLLLGDRVVGDRGVADKQVANGTSTSRSGWMTGGASFASSCPVGVIRSSLIWLFSASLVASSRSSGKEAMPVLALSSSVM
jgi:hypothetical protein